MRYFWALTLFVIGSAFLGAEFELWGYDSINKIWQFWPLILVFGGLSLLVKGLKYAWAIMMVFFVASLILIYGVAFTDYDFGGLRKEIEREVERKEIVIRSDEEIDSQEVTIKSGAINFNVGGISEDLVSGYLDSEIMKPIVTTKIENRIAKSEIFTEGIKGFWFGGFIFKNQMRLSFDPALPLSLKFQAGASDLKLDLADYLMKELSIDAGASSIVINLGEVTQKEFIIDAKTGASSIKINIPADYNVKIDSESALSSVNAPENIENPKAVVRIKLSSAATSLDVTRK